MQISWETQIQKSFLYTAFTYKNSCGAELQTRYFVHILIQKSLQSWYRPGIYELCSYWRDLLKANMKTQTSSSTDLKSQSWLSFGNHCRHRRNPNGHHISAPSAINCMTIFMANQPCWVKTMVSVYVVTTLSWRIKAFCGEGVQVTAAGCMLSKKPCARYPSRPVYIASGLALVSTVHSGHVKLTHRTSTYLSFSLPIRCIRASRYHDTPVDGLLYFIPHSTISLLILAYSC